MYVDWSFSRYLSLATYLLLSLCWSKLNLLEMADEVLRGQYVYHMPDFIRISQLGIHNVCVYIVCLIRFNRLFEEKQRSLLAIVVFIDCPYIPVNKL